MRCSSGRTGTSGAGRGRSPCDRNGSGAAESTQPGSVAEPHVSSRRGRLHNPGARRPAAAHSHRSSIAVAGCLRCSARGTGKLQPPQRRVEVRAQLRTARLRGRRKRSYDQRATVRQGSEAVRDEVAQAPADPVPHHGIAHGLAHHEPCLLPLAGVDERVQHKAAAPGSDAAAHDGTEFLTAPQASVGGKHARSDPAAARSGGQLLTALATASGHDGAARPRTHPQPESVGPRASTVVRLEGALAHGVILLVWRRNRSGVATVLVFATGTGAIVSRGRPRRPDGRDAVESAADLSRVRTPPPTPDTAPCRRLAAHAGGSNGDTPSTMGSLPE